MNAIGTKKIGLRLFLVIGIGSILLLTIPHAASAKRTVKGKITDMTGKPASGILVKAWDSDSGSKNDFMGQTRTNSSGYYQIKYKSGHWDKAPHSVTTWRPDIFIVAYAKIKGREVKVKQSKTYKDRKHKHDTTINLKLTGISGKITESSGKPAAGFRVRAWDADGATGGKHDHLNDAYTDAHGRYFMMYEGKHWDPAAHNVTTWRPDIFLKVLRKVDNYWVRVGKSPKYNNWPHRNHLTINMTVPENKPVSRNTSFDPAKHGWKFCNRKFTVCAAPTCNEKSWAGKHLRQFLTDKWSLCGGFSMTSLKRYRRYKPVESFSPTLKEEFVKAQFDTYSENIWAKFLEYTARPNKPHTVALHTIGDGTKGEWWKVKKKIDAGQPVIMGLILAGPSNNPKDVFNNHQVLAVGYTYNNGTKEVQIRTYDPNYQDVKCRVEMNIGIPGNQINAVRYIPKLQGQKEIDKRGNFIRIYKRDAKGRIEYQRSKMRGFIAIEKGSGLRGKGSGSSASRESIRLRRRK